MRTALTSTALTVILAVGMSGCGGGGSLFYRHPKPQAIQRDTVTPTGVQTTTQDPQNAVNGTVKITPVEFLDLKPVTLSVDSVMATGTFKNPRTLMLPPGFSASLYATDLGSPRDIILRDDGTIIYSDNKGRIVALGADKKQTVLASDLRNPHGMDWHNGALYYTDETRVFRFDFSSPTSLTGTSTQLNGDIPRGGLHYTRTIRWVQNDKRFYISIGSTSNSNDEELKEHIEYSAVVRMSEGGGRLDVTMRGLRDAVGMDVHPETGELWATESATDGMGANIPPDEINILRIGKHYGWPYYYGDNFIDPDYSKMDPAFFPKGAVTPVVQLQSHSTPTDLQFYAGTELGQEWKNSMIIVQRGPRFGDVSVGSKVIRVRCNNDGSNARQADFISGFVDENKKVWGYPTCIAIAKDGLTFYLTDEVNGTIYKISKTR